MITNVQLEEFHKILDFFNSDEKFDIDAYNEFVEEPKVFFKLLSSFDRKKIAKILSENKNKKKKTNEQINFNPSENEVLEIINKSTTEELEKKYSLTELKIMYEKLYSGKPLCKTNKSKLANSLKKFILQLQRGTDFLGI
ncbi:hypothetical protein [uncultured Treponema sp.]|uniref:hypothetical protein n=1 Tax=uncultured Treponema sp. TaxID=162155 RepID=UPI002591ADBE|nr:hypothetical protein [uncultured Treponema sp.]